MRKQLLALVLCCSALSFAQTTEKYATTDFTLGTINIYNVSDNSLVETIQGGGSPSKVAVAANGRILYVSNTNSNYISVIDTSIGREVRRVHGVSSRQSYLTADGALLFAAEDVQNVVDVINTSDLSLQKISLVGLVCDDNTPQRCDVPFEDQGIVTVRGVALVGHKAYLSLAADYSSRVMTVDLDTHAVSSIAGTALGNAGTRDNAAATPDGHYVIVTRPQGRWVEVIDTHTDTLVQAFQPPTQFRNVQIGTIGGAVYAFLNGPASISVYSVAPNGQLGFVSQTPAPFNAFGSALSSDASKLYLVTPNFQTPDLAVYDTSKLLSGQPDAQIATSSAGTEVDSVTTGFISTQAPPNAPAPSGVAPNVVVSTAANDSDRTITVSGSNFGPGAQVRVGNLDPITLVSGQATIPLDSAVQGGDLIVSTPDSGQFESGLLLNAFTIAAPATYQPVNQVVSGNFANSSMGILNVSTNASVTPVIQGPLSPLGVGVSSDGQRAYVTEYVKNGVWIYNIATGAFEAEALIDADDAIGQSVVVVSSIDPSTGNPIVYVLGYNPAFNDTDYRQTLYKIDAKNGSSTINQVLGAPLAVEIPQFDDGSALGLAIAATSNGRYVYTTADGNQGGKLVIFDALAGYGTVIDQSSLGLQQSQQHLIVSPDDQSLLANDTAGNIVVLDISNPLAPSNPRTIAGSAPAGLSTPQFGSFRIPSGNPHLLIAYDSGQHIVQAFNFDTSVSPNDFHQRGSFVIPTVAPQTIDSIGLDVTADGSLIYVTVTQEDAIAVLDTATLLANGNALLTKIVSGKGPVALAVRPGTPTSAGTSVTVQPIPAVQISGDFSSAGATTVSTTNTSPYSVPAGFTFGNLPVFYEIQSTATLSSPATVCITYDPAVVGSQANNLVLLHWDTSSCTTNPDNSLNCWNNITTSVNTASHQVCGQTSHFSPFVLGFGTTGLLFDSLMNAVSNSGIQPDGEMKSLRAKVLAARSAFDHKNNTAAANQLAAFNHELDAQSKNPSVAAAKAELESLANSLISRLR